MGRMIFAKPVNQKGQQTNKKRTPHDITWPRLEKNLTNSSLSSIGGALKTVPSAVVVFFLVGRILSDPVLYGKGDIYDLP